MKDLLPLLRVVFQAIVRAILPALFDEAKRSLRDTAEDVMPQPELKARLHKRIREHWRGAIMTMLLTLVCLAGSGCGSRAFFVQGQDPVRLREAIPRAKVWVMGADGKPVAAVLRLEPGLYILSDPGESSPAEGKSAENQAIGSPAGLPTGMALPPDIPIVSSTPAPAPMTRSFNP